MQRHETARGVSKTHVLRRKNFNRVDLTRVYRNEYFNLCRMLMWNIVIRNESQNVNTIFIFCIRTMIYAIYNICIYIYDMYIYYYTDRCKLERFHSSKRPFYFFFCCRRMCPWEKTGTNCDFEEDELLSYRRMYCTRSETHAKNIISI